MLRWGVGANGRVDLWDRTADRRSPPQRTTWSATDGTGSAGTKPSGRDDDAIEVGYSPLAEEYGGQGATWQPSGPISE